MTDTAGFEFEEPLAKWKREADESRQRKRRNANGGSGPSVGRSGRRSEVGRNTLTA